MIQRVPIVSDTYLNDSELLVLVSTRLYSSKFRSSSPQLNSELHLRKSSKELNHHLEPFTSFMLHLAIDTP